MNRLGDARLLRSACAAALALIAAALPARADLRSTQLLVVYNSPSPGATAVVDAYLAVHPDIPPQHVLDLADPRLAGRADLEYDEFADAVRNPIRRYLENAGGTPPNDIRAVLLIRGIPHRILDLADPLVGDAPADAADAFVQRGNATYASVDSELTLLRFDLAAGEAGRRMDSLADNVVLNPLHGSASFDAPPADRAVKQMPTFTPIRNVAWSPSADLASQMLLVCRLDGPTPADVIAAIDRAQNLTVNRTRTAVVIDEGDPLLAPEGNPELDDDLLVDDDDAPAIPAWNGNDYELTADRMSAAGWFVLYDKSTDFLLGPHVGRPVIAYASYGENHGANGSDDPPGDGRYVDSFDFAPGAIFNSLESFNGRALNGLDRRFGQGQVADFIADGGTFAVGNVFEPFSFAVADNEILFDAFLNRGLTWAEAAWTAIPVLSWQHVVIGDPLARVQRVIADPADLDEDGRVDFSDFAAFAACYGRRDLPPADACTTADFNADRSVDLADFTLFQNAIE